MDDVDSSKQTPSIVSSILAKFQQMSKEKEEAAKGIFSKQPPQDSKLTMDDVDSLKKTPSVASSILAKFQQMSKEKEEAAKGIFSKQPPQDSTERNERSSKRKAPEQLHRGLDERDVGMTEFMSDLPGFHGIIKHRFSDFQVHEIDREGNIVQLTSSEVPDISKITPEEFTDEELKSSLSQEDWDRLEKLIATEEDEASIEISLDEGKTKEDRARIHKAVKKKYGPKISSNTVTADDKTFIEISKCTKSKDRRTWPQNLPPFLHFTVCKENMDTTKVIYSLSKQLKLKPNYLTYAGTKDRRGKTSQRMCVKLRQAEAFAKVPKWNMWFGNFEYKDSHIRLGDLSGNKFTIAIRNLTADQSVIEEALTSIKAKGFINYFGLQRFGCSVEVPTYLIGKALLKRDWKQAVELILKPRPDEKSQHWIRLAREEWWRSRDARKALRILGKGQTSIEAKVLAALCKNPADFHGALFAIPRNTLLIYLHSYQSLVWNKIISRRIEKFGTAAQVGDLIRVSSPEVGEQREPVVTGENGTSESPDQEHASEEEDDQAPTDKEEKTKVCVKSLTEVELSGITCCDLVYPLPGWDVVYPKNIIGDWYQEILKEDGVQEEDFQNKEKMFALYGSYRRAFQKVENLEWRFVQYQSMDEDLILSDVDLLEEKTLPEQPPDAPLKGVIIDMSLEPSTYATMVLREAMKINTSVSFHASLSQDTQKEVKRTRKSSDPEDEQEKQSEK